MQQRLINFDSDPTLHSSAESQASDPSSHAKGSVHEFVRPDRQLDYDGTCPALWPPYSGGDDSIAVDRLHEDIDGPSHRFVICLGDTVEVFVDSDLTDIAEVTDISHVNREVLVSFREGRDEVWVDAANVYPTTEELARSARPRGALRSAHISKAKVEPPVDFSNAVIPPPSYTFDDYKAFCREFADGSLTHSEYQSQFARLLASREALISELKSRFQAKELAATARRMGSWGKGETKDANAKEIYRRMLSSFVTDGTVSYSMGESYEEAVRSKVEALTPEVLKQVFAEREAQAQEHEKALTNPETFLEFRSFLQSKSEEDLTDEQLARYDVLHADVTRGRRAEQNKTTVEQFQSSELQEYAFQIKQGFHDKRQRAVWIVQLTSRVERATFEELSRKARMLGGWYSSFKKSEAGFHFLEEERAQRFSSLLCDNADRSDVLLDRKQRREQTAAEQLHELARDLAERSEEAIERSNLSLQNTARRADIQAGVRGRAYADQALARTIHSIAEALSCGKGRYLDGLRQKTQIEALDSILYLAKWARVRSATRCGTESNYAHGRVLGRIEDEPIGPKDVRFAKYPTPEVYKRNLDDLVLRCRGTRGVRQAAEKMRKRLSREKEDFVTFRNECDVEELSSFLSRAKGAGFDVERIEGTFEKYRRLQRANITDVHELRSALREYLGHRAAARGDNPVRVAERELIGKKLPGFFPTPPAVIARMLELAQIGPEHSVLEPSCGKGDIVDAVIAAHPGVKLHAIERNHTLAEVLSAKGHAAEFADFLEHGHTYDRVVMNPPFENGQDMEHVRHAHSLLLPGGRLVSVMSEGAFFRVDNRSVAFRDWLEERRAAVERLPEDAFAGIDAFRQTSVSTRLVVIDKEADA